MIGLGRFGSIEQASLLRYVTFSNFFWLGFVNLLLINIYSVDGSRWKPFRVVAAVLSLVGFMLAQTWTTTQITSQMIVDERYYERDAVEMLQYDQLPSRETTSQVYFEAGTPETFGHYIQLMHQYRLNLFYTVE